MDKKDIDVIKINNAERALECERFQKTKFYTKYFLPYLEAKIERWLKITEVKGKDDKELLMKLHENKAKHGAFQNILSDIKSWSSVKVEGGEK